MLLQWADTYSSVLRAGDDFTQLVPVKSVVLTVFPIFSKLRNPHTVFEIRSMENPEIALTDHFRMHFLRLGDVFERHLEGLEELFGGLRHWMNFFIFADTISEDKMTQLQPRRIKSSQSPERKLRCYRTGLCLFFAIFSRQPCKLRKNNGAI